MFPAPPPVQRGALPAGVRSVSSAAAVNRHLALILNTVLPGTGLLLRRPGLLPAVPAVVGAAGLSLVALAWWTSGSTTTLAAGWIGLAAWSAAAVAAAAGWMVQERPSSRDLAAIQPLFREIAGLYLRHELPAAERTARRLVALATGEPGAWRLLAMIARAQGDRRLAERSERAAARLDLPQA
jgi:hypothetical protein